MPAKLSLKFDHPEQLLAPLFQVDEALRSRIAEQSLKAATKPMVQAAKERAPKRSGLLRLSIGNVLRKYQQGRVWVSVFGPRVSFRSKKRTKLGYNPSKYAHLVEYGTKPHIISRTIERQGENGQKTKYTRNRLHPGARPKPFMRPAFDGFKDMALATLKRELGTRVTAAAKGHKG